MSLMRLLTAGKCLVGLKEPVIRYRMSDPRALPKFGIGSKPKGGSAKPAAPAPTVTRMDRSARPDRIDPIAGVAVAQTRVTRQASLFEKLSGMLPGRRGPARSAIPRWANPPVQGELALDKVQVVRNDLSDSDLEIVPKQEHEGPGPVARAIAGIERTEPVETAWGRATMRMFGVGKT